MHVLVYLMAEMLWDPPSLIFIVLIIGAGVFEPHSCNISDMNNEISEEIRSYQLHCDVLALHVGD